MVELCTLFGHLLTVTEIKFNNKCFVFFGEPRFGINKNVVFVRDEKHSGMFGSITNESVVLKKD
jgi:hypothetical protein